MCIICKLSTLLDTYQVKAFEEVKIEAQDAYQVVIAYQEVQADKAHLLKQEDKGLRLIVFGDPNSKRSLSDVCKIMIDETRFMIVFFLLNIIRLMM